MKYFEYYLKLLGSDYCMADQRKKIVLGIALIPVLFLIISLYVVISLFKQDPHIPLICAAAVAAIVAIIHKYPWKEIQEGPFP